MAFKTLQALWRRDEATGEGQEPPLPIEDPPAEDPPPGEPPRPPREDPPPGDPPEPLPGDPGPPAIDDPPDGDAPRTIDEPPETGDAPMRTAPGEEVDPGPPTPPVVHVGDLDWDAVRRAAEPAAVRARIRETVERCEALLEDPTSRMLFDEDRYGAEDRVIRIAELTAGEPLWFIGDLHGDLLALEAALALIARPDAAGPDEAPGDAASDGAAGEPRLVFLGDLFDDGGYGLEVLLRVCELIADRPQRVCVLAGNHDEALSFDGARFAASVEPDDFSRFLNAHLDDEWLVRAGRMAVRLFERAPRALFLPDGLLVAHGGFPLTDLHETLRETGDWNDGRCLADFVWTRASARARRKIPNRTTRGCQFGREDFALFCALSAELGRPVDRMVRGHDHVEERFAVYEAYRPHPLVTIVALSRRLERETLGPYERTPCVARWVPGGLPQVHRLAIPGELIRELYPEPAERQAPRDEPALEAAGA